MITHITLGFLLGLFTIHIGFDLNDLEFWLIIITGNMILLMARIALEWK